MSTTDPAAIARGLSKAQRALLLDAEPGEFVWKRDEGLMKEIRRLSRLHLVEVTRLGGGSVLPLRVGFCLAPLGQQVRAILESSDAGA